MAFSGDSSLILVLSLIGRQFYRVLAEALKERPFSDHAGGNQFEFGQSRGSNGKESLERDTALAEEELDSQRAFRRCQ